MSDMIYVANPIYDSVFKYLMEDERVARTVLSALLKKDVVSVELRPHEYANETNDKISMFRIDFRDETHPYRTSEDVGRDGDPSLPSVSWRPIQ